MNKEEFDKEYTEDQVAKVADNMDPAGLAASIAALLGLKKEGAKEFVLLLVDSTSEAPVDMRINMKPMDAFEALIDVVSKFLTESFEDIKDSQEVRQDG